MSRPAADDSEVLAAAPPPQTEAVPAVSLVETPQWLRPVQLGPATLLEWSRRPDTLAAVEATLALLAPDDYVDFMRRYYRLGRERFGAEWAYADQLTVLQAAARLLRPERYLEIGVFRGRSLSIVAAAAPACELFGFDLWIPGYAGLDNAGPELVREQLRRVGHAGGCRLESGRSGETLPRFLRDSPDLYFDLVTVDGDHGEEGARADLEAVLPRVRVGGVLVFDDIRHPRHPWLDRVWDEVVGALPSFSSAKYVEVGHGIAFGVRVERDDELTARLSGDATRRLETVSRQLVELRAKREELLAVIQQQRQDLGRVAELDRMWREVESASNRGRRQAVVERHFHELARIPALEAEISQLEAQREVLEADRAKRLEVIESQGVLLGQARAEANLARAQVDQLERQVELLEADRAKRLEVIESQGVSLGQALAEANLARAQVNQLERQMELLEADRAKRLEIIESQGVSLGQALAEANFKRVEVEQLKRQMDALEADRAARLAIIERQGGELGRAQADANVARAELQQWRAQAEASAAASARAESEVETLRRQAEASECEIRRLRAQIQAVGGAVESARTELASARLPLLTPRKLTRVRGHMAEAARNLAAPSTDGDSPADSPSGNSGD